MWVESYLLGLIDPLQAYSNQHGIQIGSALGHLFDPSVADPDQFPHQCTFGNTGNGTEYSMEKCAILMTDPSLFIVWNTL